MNNSMSFPMNMVTFDLPGVHHYPMNMVLPLICQVYISNVQPRGAFDLTVTILYIYIYIYVTGYEKISRWAQKTKITFLTQC